MVTAADRAGAWKVVVLLFLPLAVALEACRWWGADLESLRAAPRTFRVLARSLPLLSVLNYAVWRHALAAGALLVLASRFCPASRRKTFLAAAAAGYLAWLFWGRCALGLFAGLAMQWAALRCLRAPWAKVGAALAGGALIAWGSWGIEDPVLSYVAWSFAILSLLKTYSAVQDEAGLGGGAPWQDFFLYMVGGFPCNSGFFMYSYAPFTRAFDAAPYWETAKGGIIRVYSGAAKLALLYACEFWLLPRWGLSRPLPAGSGGAELWMGGIFLLFAYLLRVVAFAEVLQGTTRLFGYAVPDQCDRPWLASSPLDFWRRYANVNRLYLLQYVSMPTYRTWPNLYAAIGVTFLLSALNNVAHRIPFLPPAHRVDIGVLIAVNTALFAALCCLEMRLRRSAGARRLAARAPLTPGRRAAAVATMLGVLILLRAPMPDCFPLNFPAGVGAGRIWSRYAHIYGKMLFLPETRPGRVPDPGGLTRSWSAKPKSKS